MDSISIAPGADLERIVVDRRERSTGYAMRSHHAHGYFELVYIEHGSCRYWIEDTMCDLQDGDFLLVPPRLLHYTQYPFGACRRCILYFHREDLSGELLAHLPGGESFLQQMRIFQTPDPSRRQIAALLTAMEAEQHAADGRTPLMLRLQLQQLLLLSGRVCSVLQDAPAEIHTTDRQILLAAHFINDHFRQQITAADIAAAAGFSPNYLSRKFREAVGVGVHDYLVSTRLRNAAFELLSTGMSVTQIALHCGFSDSNYFKDVFKKKYGVTPRDYRKNHL